MTVAGDSSQYFTFVSFPTIFTLHHFICTSTKYFICDCQTGPYVQTRAQSEILDMVYNYAGSCKGNKNDKQNLM